MPEACVVLRSETCVPLATHLDKEHVHKSVPFCIPKNGYRVDLGGRAKRCGWPMDLQSFDEYSKATSTVTKVDVWDFHKNHVVCTASSKRIQYVCSGGKSASAK